MGKDKENKDTKLNKKLKISAIIFFVSAILALIIILNKGVILGFRLVSLSENGGSSSEPMHVIQIVATNNYLKNIGDTVELKLSIDGEDVANRGRV